MHGRIKCANCSGNHLSNSTNGPIYTERLKYMTEKRINKPEPKQQFVEAPRPEQNPWKKPEQNPQKNPEPETSTNQPPTNCASKITGEDKKQIQDFLELIEEIKKLNELINITKMLPLQRRIEEPDNDGRETSRLARNRRSIFATINKLKIIPWNTNSLTNKTQELDAFL
jgi:hypothetical protein